MHTNTASLPLSLVFVAAASLLTVACGSSDPDRAHATLPPGAAAPAPSATTGADPAAPPAPSPTPAAAQDAGADAAPVASFGWLVGSFTLEDYMGTHLLHTNVLTLAKDGTGSFEVRPPAWTNPTPDMIQHTDFTWTTDGKSITAGNTVYPIASVSANCRTIIMDDGRDEWTHVLGDAPCPTSPAALTAVEAAHTGTWRYKEADQGAFTGELIELKMDADRFYRITLQPTMYTKNNPANETQVFDSYFSIDGQGVIHGTSPSGQENNTIWKLGDGTNGMQVCTYGSANPTCFPMTKTL